MTPQEAAEWVQVAPWLVAFFVVGAVIIWVTRKLAPALKKITDMADDFLGEKARPGVPARPGVMERLAMQEKAQDDAARDQSAIADTLEVVRHELFPNSGKSLRDAVDGVRTDITEINGKLSNDNQRLEAVEQRVTEAIKVIEENHG
ncbi:MAG: hypothetical protein ACTH4Y_07995 [Microbacterium gubbeenense]|uniref:hypothetical protein n=1 Tax=Microbacterium gubbeenense TaxID=159896 RepID=UPI003F98F7F0